MPPAVLASVPPSLAIEIAPGRVSVVGVAGSGRTRAVSAYATETLPAEAVVPGLTGTNIPDAGVVVEALRQALTRAGLQSARRAALIVPDSVARVSLLTFEQLPARHQDLDQLVRWQLKKAMPFPIDEAQVAHFPAHKADGTTTLAAVAARRDVIRQYEAVVAAAGVHAGVVDLASFNVMNAVIAAGAASPADWLVVHVAAESTSLAILRGEDLMFYRHRLAVDEEPLGALVHQTAMYHQDRLGGAAFARVWLSGAGLRQSGGLARVADEIAQAVGLEVEAVDVSPIVSFRDRIAPTPEVLDTLAAPVGMLLREQGAA